MALIQYGAGVAGASGALAGQVFSHNRGGAYLRRRSVPTNPNSQAQKDQRFIMAVASANWKRLTPAERAAWQAYALTHPIVNRLGATVILSGQQKFVQIYSNYATFTPALLPLVDPPADAAYAAPFSDGSGLDISDGGNTISYKTGLGQVAGDTVAVFASPAVTQGRTFVKNLMRLVHVEIAAGVVAPGTVIDISAGWISVFGNLTGTLGNKVIAELYGVSNGQLSVAQGVEGDVAA